VNRVGDHPMDAGVAESAPFDFTVALLGGSLRLEAVFAEPQHHSSAWRAALRQLLPLERRGRASRVRGWETEKI
jgi:hypothetical protein